MSVLIETQAKTLTTINYIINGLIKPKAKMDKRIKTTICLYNWYKMHMAGVNVLNFLS